MWLSCRVDASIERFHTICRGHQWLRVTAAIPMKLVNAPETVFDGSDEQAKGKKSIEE